MKRVSPILAAVLLLSMLLIPLPLHAGSNGQQLVVYICGADYVDIEGANHNGVWKTYRLWTDPHTCVTKKISNWWWKGEVTLTAYDPAGISRSMTVFVPKSQGGDEFAVDMLPFGMSDVYMERAQRWVDEDVRYSAAVHEDYPPYRMDCSGYVSYVWQLPIAANTTTLKDYAYEIEWWDLTPGDAINDQESGDYGHVVIFAGWQDYDALTFWAYEENYDTGAALGIRQLEQTDGGYSIPDLNMYNVVFQRADY